MAPDATHISVREVLAKFDTDLASIALAAENGEFALWVGSGISRQAPDLGNLIERAFEYLRQKALDPHVGTAFTRALDEAVTLAGLDPAKLRPQYSAPFSGWPEKDEIVKKLWDQYSDLLDIRIIGERGDFMLWDAIDIRTAFAHPNLPAATHLCIGILIMEGAVKTVASGNWDGFIEEAVARLGNGTPGILQVVVDPDHLREPPALAKLLKFHGCVVYAAKEPAMFRKYLTGSRTQITQWPDNPEFAAMVNTMIGVATNQKTMVLGLSTQDYNLQTIFSKAKQVNAWPWPCTPHAPGHVFCGDQITKGQSNVLKIVYGDAYDICAIDIQAATHVRAWAEQVLIALVLKVLTDKLVRLMQSVLESIGLTPLLTSLQASVVAFAGLRRGSRGARQDELCECGRRVLVSIVIHFPIREAPGEPAGLRGSKLIYAGRSARGCQCDSCRPRTPWIDSGFAPEREGQWDMGIEATSGYECDIRRLYGPLESSRRDGPSSLRRQIRDRGHRAPENRSICEQ